MRLARTSALLLALSATLLGSATSAPAARPFGEAPAVGSARGGKGSFTVYFRDGRTMRAKAQPVFVLRRVVFVAPDDHPHNVPIESVDVERTRAQGSERGLTAATGVVTNRELRFVGGHVSAVEVGNYDPENPTSTTRGSGTTGEAGSETEAAAPRDKPARDAGASDASSEMRNLEMQQLMRQRNELQAELTRLQSQRRVAASQPGGLEQLDAQINTVSKQIADIQSRMSASQRSR